MKSTFRACRRCHLQKEVIPSNWHRRALSPRGFETICAECRGKQGARQQAPMTDRQSATFWCIVNSIAQRGYPPSTRELCVQLGIASTHGVEEHLTALVRKGFLRKDAHVSRGLALTPKGLAYVANRNGNPTVSMPVETRVFWRVRFGTGNNSYWSVPHEQFVEAIDSSRWSRRDDAREMRESFRGWGVPAILVKVTRRVRTVERCRPVEAT